MPKQCWIVVLLLAALPLCAANPFMVGSRPGPDGRTIDVISVPGIPPALRSPGPEAQPSRSAVMLTGVPAFDWSYGCSATSAAMMAGYYDRGNFGHVYTGPANGGVVPLDNSGWGNGECPLSATHTGYDGLTGAGHVERFWTNSNGSDPFGTSDPTGTYFGCTADYMGTNQDWWGNSDGSTTFAFYTDGSPLYDPADGMDGPPYFRDGIHGLRLFFESRGYSVNINYNQYILGWDGNNNGYTLDQFRASIDAGIPVMIQIQGHSMVGIGYESLNDMIYILNTWDYSVHSMIWGGSYSDMAHYGVAVLELNQPPLLGISADQLTASLAPGATGTDSIVLSNNGTGALTYSLTQSELARAGGASDSAAKPERSIAGSSLSLDTSSYQPSATLNWTFSVYNGSPDDEWLREVFVRLPAGITVNSTSGFTNGGGGTMNPEMYSENGETVIHWFSDLSSWGVVYPGNSAVATINVTLSGTLAGTLYLPWEIRGDVYGADPHVLNGTIELTQIPWPVDWFHATPVAGTILPGGTQTITGFFDAEGLEVGSHHAQITVRSNDPWNPQQIVNVTLNVTGGGVPQIVSLVSVSEGTFLSWTPLPGASQYKIYRSWLPDSGFVPIATVSGSSFSDSEASRQAFYRVTALY